MDKDANQPFESFQQHSPILHDAMKKLSAVEDESGLKSDECVKRGVQPSDSASNHIESINA